MNRIIEKAIYCYLGLIITILGVLTVATAYHAHILLTIPYLGSIALARYLQRMLLPKSSTPLEDRIKSTIRIKWHVVIKVRIKDFFKGERYVPLYWAKKAEIRAIQVSHYQKAYREEFRLPPGRYDFSELPRFRTSDACYKYIAKTWSHLQP